MTRRKSGEHTLNPIRLRRFALILAAAWTSCVLLSLFWNLHQEKQEIFKIALSAARSSYDKDLIYRRWNASHGGVYVPVTESTRPNPYLEVAERDITTLSGRQLTLINPAYMSRQVYEMPKLETETNSRLVSLDPLNPSNKPDPWEREALGRLEQGEPEVSLVETREGKSHLRLLRPMRVEESCLKCHARQGYRTGEIRGGLSIQAPLDDFEDIFAPRIQTAWLGHVSLWLAGLGGIGLSGRRLDAQIRKRESAEMALSESERRFKEMLDRIRLCAVILDGEGKIVFANDSLLNLTGWQRDEILGLSWCDHLVPRESASHCRQILQAGIASGRYPAAFESEISTRQGRKLLIRWNSTLLCDPDGGITGIASVGEDITDQQYREEQLRQLQKAEALGTLTGGIAHDFNNLLTAIIGYASLMQMKLGENDPFLKNVEKILQAGERGANLTHALLAYSRKEPIARQPLDLNQCVRDMCDPLTRVLGEETVLEITLAAEGLTVAGDRGKLEQVLLNLASNARDAMPSGGRLSISTQRLEAGEGQAPESGGRYALLTVSDTGIGIESAKLHRIFDPFFTTKDVDKGVGLGLATAYGIIKQHGGEIEAKSTPGEGAAFRIYLPLIAEEATESAPLSASPLLKEGRSTLLLVEDDPDVRATTRELLEQFGYKVLEAEGGSEALELFRKEPEEIGLVISDMIMPKMNGGELLQGLREIRPDIRIIFMSGYTSDILKGRGLTGEEFTVLTKPVPPAELRDRIGAELQQKRTS